MADTGARWMAAKATSARASCRGGRRQSGSERGAATNGRCRGGGSGARGRITHKEAYGVDEDGGRDGLGAVPQQPRRDDGAEGVPDEARARHADATQRSGHGLGRGVRAARVGLADA